jgi:hypothetical protein
MFQKLHLFPSVSEGGETFNLLDWLERANLNHWMVQWLRLGLLALSNQSNRVDVFHPSPVDRNRSSFQSVLLYFIEYQMKDKIQNHSSP